MAWSLKDRSIVGFFLLGLILASLPVAGCGETAVDNAPTAAQQEQAASLIQRMRDTKMLARYDCKELNEAYLEPLVWDAGNVDSKRGITMALATTCYVESKKFWITVLDYRSGKKLAKYNAFGFELY